MAPASASRSVEEQIGNYQVADPPTNRSQFVDLFVRSEQVGVVPSIYERECARPGEIRPAEVDFQAADNSSPLPIVAKLEAENTTLRTRVGRQYERIDRTGRPVLRGAFRH